MSGHVEVDISKKFDWLSLEAIFFILEYARDIYIANGFHVIREDLLYYVKCLEEILRYSVDGFDKTRVQSVKSQMESLINRYDQKLDFFGNPAGYIPLLSMEMHMSAYQSELESVTRALYLQIWYNYYKGKQLKSLELVSAEIISAQHDIMNSIESFNGAQDDLQMVESAIQAYGEEKKRLDKILEEIQERVDREARNNVERRKMAANFCHMIKGLASLIPYGQPALGAAAGFATDISQKLINGERPGFGEVMEGVADVASSLMNTKLPTIREIKGLTGTAEENDPKNGGVYTPSNCNCAEIAGLGDKLAAASSVVSRSLSKMQVSDTDLNAELSRLLNQDPLFKIAGAAVDSLQRKSVALNDLMTKTMSKTNDLVGTIVSNNVGLGQIYENRNDLLQSSSSEIDNWIETKASLAKAKIQKAGYMLAKSFEYYALENVQLNGSLDKLYKFFMELAKKFGDRTVPSFKDFEAVSTAIYDDTFQKVSNQLVAKYGDMLNRKIQNVTITLTAKQTMDLSRKGFVKLDFSTVPVLLSTEDNVRVLSVAVDEVHLAFGRKPPSKIGFLMFHGPDNFIHHNGHKYRFTRPFKYFKGNQTVTTKKAPHDNRRLSPYDIDETGQPTLYSPPISWKSIYDVPHEHVTNLQHDHEGVAKNQYSALTFLPSFLGDWFIVTEGVDGESLDRVTVQHLSLTVQVSSSDRASNLQKMRVVTLTKAGDPITAPILVKSSNHKQEVDDGDNSLNSGYGDITRYFQTSQSTTTISLKVEKQFGSLKFMGWRQSTHGSEYVSKTPEIHVSPDKSHLLFAIYG